MRRLLFVLFLTLLGCGGDVDPEDDDTAGCREPNVFCALASDEDFAVADDYVCLRTDADGGECFERCPHANGRSTCGSDSVCVEPVLHPETAVCRPTNCSEWRQGPLECDGGTCVEVAEGAGRCQVAGVVPVGETCVSSGSEVDELCAPQLYCDPSAGRCRRLCDLFAADCDGGTACGYLTEGQGVCLPAVGGGAFEPCSAEGAWCSDRMRCLPFQLGGGSQLLCAPYCRAQASDCAGVLYQGLPTSCDAAAFDDTSSIGLCLPQPN